MGPPATLWARVSRISDDDPSDPPSRGDDVASLIRAGASLDPIEARVAMQRIRSQLRAPTAREPVLIGRHHVIERIGSGGFGAVYEAFDPQLERKLAVKVLRVGPGADDSAESALREAKLAAQVSHPNVVAVFDVGLLDNVEELGAGVFLAMEHVDGETLASWMNANRQADWREVVRIFLQAGQGLAAAHAAGVVHRDFKPANVLLGPGDRVRVADFGLANVSNPEHDDGEAPSGTPVYMAPEQHRGEPSDARTDLYAYCVALYEALEGALPFTAADTDTLLAAKLRGEPRWSGRTPAHLQALVKHGLAPEPDERPASMEELLTALARDPTAARRRWLGGAGLALAATGLGYLLAGPATPDDTKAQCATESRVELEYSPDEVAAAFEATGLSYATDAWDKTRARLEEQATSLSAARTQLCTDRESLNRSAPELYDARAHCLERQVAELGGLVEALKTPDANIVSHALEAALALEDPAACNDARVPDRPPAETDEASLARARRVEELVTEARAQNRLGRHIEAAPIVDELLEHAQLLPTSALRAEAHLVGARMRNASGEPTEAQELALTAASDAEASGDQELTVRSKVFLSYLVGYELSRPDEGLSWARNAEGALRRLGDDPRLEAMYHRASTALFQRKGNLPRAREHATQYLELQLELHDPDHPDVATAHANLGLMARSAGDLDAAERAYREALRIQTAAFGPEHPRTATAISQMGQLVIQRYEYEEAITLFEQAIGIRRKNLPEKHPSVGRDLQWLAYAHAGLGHHQQSRELNEQSVAMLRETYPGGHPDIAYGLDHIGLECELQGDFECAEKMFREALDTWVSVGGERAPEASLPLNHLGDFLHDRGRPAEARALHERALSIATDAFGPDHYRVASSLTGLGRDLLALDEVDAAVENLSRAVELSEELKVDEWEVAFRRFALAEALWAAGKQERARDLAAQALAGYEDSPPKRVPGDERERIEQWLAAH